MGHKTLIDGVGYDIIGGHCLDDGVGYSILKGRTLDDGVGYDVAFGASGMAAGDLAVGSSVFANVNGVRTEFLVVHQGLPDATLYDTSCDGTWLLMKNIYASVGQYASSRTNAYKSSNVYSYLTNTFPPLLDAAVKNQIKTAKIPYVNGTGYGKPATGSSGLSVTVFALSAPEVGCTTSMISGLKQDGACLSYFSGTAAADAKRIAYQNSTARNWTLRSPTPSSDVSVICVTTTGSCGSVHYQQTFYVRPAFILDGSAAIDPNTFDILG